MFFLRLELVAILIIFFPAYLFAELKWVINPPETCWNNIQPLTYARTYATGDLLSDGRILVVGGTQNSNATVRRTAELVDALTGRVTTLANQLTFCPRVQHGSAKLLDGRILYVGGSGQCADNSTASRTAAVFDSASNSFRKVIGRTNYNRTSSTQLVRLPNGRVLIVSNDTPQLEEYNPNTETFKTVGTLPGFGTTNYHALVRSLVVGNEVIVSRRINNQTYKLYRIDTSSYAISEIPQPPHFDAPFEIEIGKFSGAELRLIVNEGISYSIFNLKTNIWETSKICGSDCFLGVKFMNLRDEMLMFNADGKRHLLLRPADFNSPVVLPAIPAPGRRAYPIVQFLSVWYSIAGTDSALKPTNSIEVCGPRSLAPTMSMPQASPVPSSTP